MDIHHVAPDCAVLVIDAVDKATALLNSSGSAIRNRSQSLRDRCGENQHADFGGTGKPAFSIDLMQSCTVMRRSISG